MIYESGPWRERLANIRKEIKKINTKENFVRNDEKTYSVLEQDIFLSAFIIRKLIDCKSKVIDRDCKIVCVRMDDSLNLFL